MNQTERKTLIERIKSFPHKTGVDKNDWDKIHPMGLYLADFHIQFCLEHGLEICFTRVYDDPISGISTSDSHGDEGVWVNPETGEIIEWCGRAFDARTRSWAKGFPERAAEEANKRFKIGAYTSKTGEEREAVYHNGTALHLHYQVRRDGFN